MRNSPAEGLVQCQRTGFLVPNVELREDPNTGRPVWDKHGLIDHPSDDQSEFN